MAELKLVDITGIRTDGGTQIRVELDTSHVNDLVDAIADGKELPPIDVMYDGASYWLVDGFHRLIATKRSTSTQIRCNVELGDKRDAILAACGVNAEHGLKRTNADKRNAVMTLLEDDEWSGRSNRWIATTCRVSDTFVSKLRPSSQVQTFASDQKIGRGNSAVPSNGNIQPLPGAVVGRDGKTYPPRSSAASRVGDGEGIDKPKTDQVESGGGQFRSGSTVLRSNAEDAAAAVAVEFDVDRECEGLRVLLAAQLKRWPEAERWKFALVLQNVAEEIVPGGKSKMEAVSPDVAIPDELNTTEFRRKWEEWCLYRKEKRKKVSPRAAKQQLKELSEHGVAVAVRAIEVSIASDWQGLFPDKIAAEFKKRGDNWSYSELLDELEQEGVSW